MKRYNIRVTKKNLIEMIIGKAIVFILECILAIAIILGFFWCIGMLQTVVEKFPILWCPLIAGTIITIFKMVQESE